MKLTLIALALFCASILLGGCSESSHDPHDHDDHDVITTVTFTLKPTNAAGDSLVYVWEDIDGVGGNNPNRIDTMKLATGVLYACTVKLENRSVNPAKDVTSEIAADKDEHQFLYTISDWQGAITVLDRDSRDLPVGLVFNLQTTITADAVPGTFGMRLFHYDNATDKVAGVPGEETDISIQLPVTRFAP
jgi:hypothetical protein